MAEINATPAEVENFLKQHPQWDIIDGFLHRTFTFRNFREAFGFMTEVALYTERKNHHPEWSNVYNKVSVNLTTHDTKGITSLDFDLADEMDRIAGRR